MRGTSLWFFATTLLISMVVSLTTPAVSTAQSSKATPVAVPYAPVPTPIPVPSAKLDQMDLQNPTQGTAKLEQQYKKNPTSEMRLLTHYLEAQIWAASAPEKACGLWLATLTEPGSHKFTLHQLARLRAFEVCTVELPPTSEPIEPWLKELNARISLGHAIQNHDQDREMAFSIEVAEYEKVARDRTRLLQRALELAKIKKDPQQISQTQALLEKAAPRFITAPKPEQFLMVAGDFKQVRDFVNARKFYKKVIANKAALATDRLKAFDGMRMTYKLKKDTPAFLAATEKMAKFARRNFFARDNPLKANLARYFDTQVSFARAVWTEHHPGRAAQILTALERDLKNHYPIDASILIRARISEEAGDLKKALAILALSDASQIEDRDLRWKVLWARAWDLRKSGLSKEAAALFEELSKDDQNPAAQMKAHYWLARTLAESKAAAEVVKNEYEWLIANDPVGYYGLLAYRDLKRPMPPLKNAAVSLLPQDLSLQGSEREMAEWLMAAREFDVARVYLDQTASSRRLSYSETQMTDLLGLYARSSNYQTLFIRLGELGTEPRKRILEAHPDFVFPTPWLQLATTAAAKFSVPVELIYAIMRQESSFNPTARSGADAFGLMQLIPEMAEQASKKTGIHVASHEDLYQPELNIPLGTAFIRQLLTHWNGQFVLSVASYNANERAILSWVQTRFAGDPLQFIEDVPYEETRNYIKLVLRNYIFYMRLNAGTSSVPFPERCLENLQAAKL